MNELTPDDEHDPDEMADVDVDVDADAEIEDVDDVDDVDAVEDDPSARDASERVEYEVGEWSGQSRSLLDSLLTSNDIQHVWQGTRLMVGAEDEAAVDGLLDEVTATATRGLDTDRERVLYEVASWSAALQTSLAGALDVAEIPYEWDENGDLVIYEDDEEAVEEILDGMPDPDDPETADADGVDVQDVLSALWEASSTLSHTPNDPDAVLEAISAASRLERMSLPFGFESSVWRDVVSKATTLRDGFESSDSADQLSDEEIMEGCAELANQVRHYI